jgi:hypothetical protein
MRNRKRRRLDVFMLLLCGYYGIVLNVTGLILPMSLMARQIHPWADDSAGLLQTVVETITMTFFFVRKYIE